MVYTDSYNYELPKHFIAQRPSDTRSEGRLLSFNRSNSSLTDLKCSDLPWQLEPTDLLVFNNTFVPPSRLMAHKSTGARVELLVERITSETSALVHARANKPIHTPLELKIGNTVSQLTQRDSSGLFEWHTTIPVRQLLNQLGTTPLPPYISRESDSAQDRERYQTIFAKKELDGSSAAPTAGLHFDKALMRQLQSRGIETAFVTLHVGRGTFLPIKTKDITSHKMHSEHFHISRHSWATIRAAKAAGRRIVAVGTTVARTLESFARLDYPNNLWQTTDLFIRPGFDFKIIDALFTNFHTPRSTLLVLLSSFLGNKGHWRDLYEHAKKKRYRFFSYGDAMLIT